MDDLTTLSKAQKMVRLVEWMLLPSGVLANEVQGKLDLDDRSLRRYLSDLRDMGIPVINRGRGPKRILRIDPSYLRNAVELTLLEAVSLQFGRSLFNFLGGTQFAEDMDDALERISPFIRQADQVRIQDLDRKLLAIAEHKKDYETQGELLDEVLTALLYQHAATVSYARLTGPPRVYTLRPYTLVTYRQGLYIFALDVAADKIKTFAVDRIEDFERHKDQPFDVPEDYRPEDLVKDCFGIIDGPLHTVELRFAAKVAPYIRERVWHPSQRVHEDPEGSITLTLTVGLGPELTQWILSFGPDVNVVRPRSLSNNIRRLHLEACS